MRATEAQAAADAQDTNATGLSAAKSGPMADLWDLTARNVTFEQVGLATWWVVAGESTGNDTELGVAHLNEDRTLACHLTPDGARIIGSNETAFLSHVASILTEIQTGAG